MKTVTTHEAKTHLSRLLKEVEQGETIEIARGSKGIALLVPKPEEEWNIRPKAGTVCGEIVKNDPAVFDALTDEELEEWGL